MADIQSTSQSIDFINEYALFVPIKVISKATTITPSKTPLYDKITQVPRDVMNYIKQMGYEQAGGYVTICPKDLYDNDGLSFHYENELFYWIVQVNQYIVAKMKKNLSTITNPSAYVVELSRKCEEYQKTIRIY